MILTDNETSVDLLNNEAISHCIIALLNEQPSRPVTIGVHGDWGAGKSSILEMIEAGLDGKDEVLCLKFNGWRFQGFEDAKIALIEGIVAGLIEKRPLLSKATGLVKDVWRRIDLLKVAKHAGGLAFTAFTGIPTPDQLQAILGGLQSIWADPAKLATKENLDAVIGSVKSIMKDDAESKSVPKEIDEFRKAFDQLLKEAGIKRLIVLIDDLDRCLPDTAIETLEAIRLFVMTEHTAFVVAADEAMIEYAVRKHFPDLPDTTGPRDYARNYLEKLIQVPFRIPALGEAETRIYVTLLLIGAVIGEENDGYKRLITASRERLKKPWDTTPIDFAFVKASLGDAAGNAQDMLVLSDQVGPTLAGGTRGNPRQIKRFLNTLLLRHQMAQGRGFGADVKLSVLAKLMLAERFLPRFFEQIATTAAVDPKGQCATLAHLEGSSAGGTSAATTLKKSVRKEPEDAEPASGALESATLAEWMASQPILSWAKVQPPIAKEDLRPYLFVTKDRKDYFGAAVALGHLAPLVEKMFGPKIAVQRLEAELRQLVPAEAAQIFEAVRSRVVGSDSFEAQPPGIDGLTVLVRTQPALQNSLIDLLEAIPVGRYGPWVVSGWEGVIADAAAVQRFEQLLQRWAAGSNAVLKIAAAGALKVRAGSRR
ncbi:Qat anti-phage system ATPase QatA [Bradyrhizobium elkanii]|uniref:Qat anti-phage system ATPase QatA n=2 Tax=Bradyrhizobium elkanii TaxID=29448 RepID=UPI0035138979